MQAHIKHDVYEVFAQIEPGGPISHIGNLNAPGIDLATTYARRIYDEERWSEMWVVPRETIVVAHPDPSTPFGPPAAGKPALSAPAPPASASPPTPSAASMSAPPAPGSAPAPPPGAPSTSGEPA